MRHSLWSNVFVAAVVLVSGVIGYVVADSEPAPRHTTTVLIVIEDCP